MKPMRSLFLSNLGPFEKAVRRDDAATAFERRPECGLVCCRLGLGVDRRILNLWVFGPAWDQSPMKQSRFPLAGVVHASGEYRLGGCDVVPLANVGDGLDAEHFGEFARFDADSESSTHSST